MTVDAATRRSWLDAATAIVQAAGANVLAQWSGARRDAQRKSRRELVTEVDRAVERAVVEGLRARFPGHAILAEEGVLTPSGVADVESSWVWMLDPIDGTTNFVHGLPFFAVALSLSWCGQLQLGVVHAPALRDTYTAALGAGAFRNGQPIRTSLTDDLADALLATGFSYDRDSPALDNAPRVARVIARCRDLRRLGSAQLDLCLTASGTFDGYWELGLQPYDLGAGALVVREAGGMVTDLQGKDAWLERGHVVATNGLLHGRLLALLE